MPWGPPHPITENVTLPHHHHPRESMRIADGWALCASAVEYLPLGRPGNDGVPVYRGLQDQAGDIRLCQAAETQAL